MKKLRGGIVGFSTVAQHLTPLVNSSGRAEIVAAYNRGEQNRSIARDKFGLRVTDNIQDLLEMDLDFFCILSSNNVHCEHVVAVAKAKKPIYCEKPIALTLEDADAMVEAVEAAGVPSIVNYSLKFVPAFQKMKEIIDSGELGRILSVWNHRLRGFGLYEAGARHPCVLDTNMSGGWTVHHACHGIDLLHWMAGDIEEVSGLMLSTLPDEQSEEITWASLRFSNGAIGVVGDSICAMRDENTGVIGTKGSLIVQGSYDHLVMRLKREDETAEEIIEVPGDKTFDGALNHFLDCLEHNTKPIATIQDARHSLAVALAIQESARRKQSVKVS